MLNDVEIGFISYVLYPEKKNIHIKKVNVIPQYQNRGVAKILIEGLLRKAKLYCYFKIEDLLIKG